jgi:hypothetical protein
MGGPMNRLVRTLVWLLVAALFLYVLYLMATTPA